MSEKKLIHPLVLEGQVVRLEPLSDAHIAPLLKIGQAKPDLYQFTSTPLSQEQADSYYAKAFNDLHDNRAYPFAMIDKTTGEIAGTTRFYDINWAYRNCIIGYTWFDSKLFGTAFNVESKYLMLCHLFDTLDMMRVQMNSDSRNERSQAAIKALGASYEGTLRASQVNKDGFVRNNMIFSIIAPEWHDVKANLENRLQKKLSSN